MSVIRPHLLLCLLPLLAGAQEPGGLEQAKQDLKTLPAVRRESERAELRLPSIAAPGPAVDLPAPRPPAVRSGAQPDDSQQGKGTGNWLVDAMMKDDSRPTAGSGRKAARARDDAHSPETETAGRDRDPGRDPNADREPLLGSRAREAAQAAGNPLAPFMADWISKRDQTLLLPKMSAGQGPGTETTGLPGNPDQPFTITFGGTGGRPDPGADPAPIQAPGNPFLQALRPLPSPPPDVESPRTVPEAGDRSPTLTPATPAREAKPPPPIDLSKPPEDKKYFPQLKRF